MTENNVEVLCEAPSATAPPSLTSNVPQASEQDAEAEGYEALHSWHRALHSWHRAFPTKPCTLGTEHFPELGLEGLHPIQLLCDHRIQTALWKVKYGHNRWGLREILHAEESAKMLAYAKVLEREVAKYANLLHRQELDPPVKKLQIGFAAILLPLKDVAKVHTLLKTWHSKAHLKKTLDDCFTFTGLAEEDLKVAKIDGSEGIVPRAASQVFLFKVLDFLDLVQLSDYACEGIQEELGDMMGCRLHCLSLTRKT